MRKLILENIWWKLFSLVLATLVWLAINTSNERNKAEEKLSPVITVSTRTLPSVPITLMMAPGNTNQFHLNPSTIAVEVSGGPDALEKLQADQINAFVDVTHIEEEKEVSKDIQVQAPRGFVIKSFKPPRTSVERITPK